MEKLSDFVFETENEVLKNACEELESISCANRSQNMQLFKEFKELVKNENKGKK